MLLGRVLKPCSSEHREMVQESHQWIKYFPLNKKDGNCPRNLFTVFYLFCILELYCILELLSKILLGKIFAAEKKFEKHCLRELMK